MGTPASNELVHTDRLAGLQDVRRHADLPRIREKPPVRGGKYARSVEDDSKLCY
jgi:hypothetical protein